MTRSVARRCVVVSRRGLAGFSGPVMPYVTTLTGFVVFVGGMAISAVQEFTQGFATPEASSIR